MVNCKSLHKVTSVAGRAWYHPNNIMGGKLKQEQKEEWEDVVGFEDYFKVSNLGRVSSKRTGKILKLHKRRDRRVTVAVSVSGIKITFSLHRLVAQAFIPNPENKPEVNHIDGNPSNNTQENLEWVTASENIIHAVNNGLRLNQVKGEQVGTSKLTTELVLWVRSVYTPRDKVYGARALARELNISHQTLLSAINNTTWN